MPRRFLPLVLALVAALLVLTPGPVRAQEGDPLAERIQVVRKLSPEQRQKLREKLHRFRSLPKAQQDALRAKARKLGAERMRELAGRDARRIRSHHRNMQAEIDQIMELLGPQRFEGLDEPEMRLIRHEAGRQFHRYIKAALLRRAQVQGDFRSLPEAEKRERMRAAWSAAKASLFNELPEAERKRINALPKKEQRREHAQLLREYRAQETHAFAGAFDRRFLRGFLEMPPERRRRKVERWVQRTRWYEVAKVLKEQLGIPREVIRLTHHFRADELAQLRKVYEETVDLTPPERRLRLEKEIREIDGRAATDDERLRRKGPPRLHHLLRNGQGPPRGEKRGDRGSRRGKKRRRPREDR